MSDATPFHLQGNFAPVREELSATDLEVIGEIPRELRGLFVRNGANPVTGKSAHWFLGNGMLHGIRLEDGRASWYRNRYVRTPFLDDPKVERIHSDGTIDRTASAANTHVIRHAGRIMALEEGSFPFVVDDQLETVGAHDFDGRLSTAMTAHPKVCPVTGELLFFGYGQLPPYLVYHRVSPDGKLVQSEEIAVAGPTMIHDFAITERSAIFMDLPVVFDLQRALEGTMPFHWSDDYGARVGIMPRTGSNMDVKWFEVDPCYVFHGLNAYDAGDQVVFDVCRISELWRDSTQLGDGSADITLHRWTFDLERGTTREETLDERRMDFPRVADACVGQKHRTAFTVQFGENGAAGSMGFAGLLKLDLERGESALHDFGEGRNPCEPAFVPAQGCDPRSDEGWILTYVYDEQTHGSELVVLDAQEFGKQPVARVPLPGRVPYGFHGSWLADPR